MFTKSPENAIWAKVQKLPIDSLYSSLKRVLLLEKNIEDPFTEYVIHSTVQSLVYIVKSVSTS